MIERYKNGEHHVTEYYLSRKERDERIKTRRWKGNHGTVEENLIILPKQVYMLNHSTVISKQEFKELEKENYKLRDLLLEVKRAAASIQ